MLVGLELGLGHGLLFCHISRKFPSRSQASRRNSTKSQINVYLAIETVPIMRNYVDFSYIRVHLAYIRSLANLLFFALLELMLGLMLGLGLGLGVDVAGHLWIDESHQTEVNNLPHLPHKCQFASFILKTGNTAPRHERALLLLNLFLGVSSTNCIKDDNLSSTRPKYV